MTVILATAGIDFFTGSLNKQTTAAYRHAGVDYSIKVDKDKYHSLISALPAYAADTLYAKLTYYSNVTLGVNEDGHWLEFRDINENLVCTLDVDNGYLRVSAHGDTLNYGASIIKATANNLAGIVVKIKVTPALIETELLLNGVSVSSTSSSNTVGFGVARNFEITPTDSFGNNYFSEFIFATHDISANNLTEEVPAAIDAASDWVGSVGSLTDEDDMTHVTGMLSGEKLILTNSYSGTDSVAEVCPVFAITTGALAPESYRIFLLIGGVFYNGPTITIPANTTMIASHSWDAYPVDDTAWLQARVAATKWGLEAMAGA